MQLGQAELAVNYPAVNWIEIPGYGLTYEFCRGANLFRRIDGLWIVTIAT